MIEPLGSWQLIKSSFALWLRFIAPFTLLTMLPAALLLLLEFAPESLKALRQYNPVISGNDSDLEVDLYLLTIFFIFIITTILPTAFVTPAVVEASQGKKIRFLYYIKRSILRLPLS